MDLGKDDLRKSGFNLGLIKVGGLIQEVGVWRTTMIRAKVAMAIPTKESLFRKI